jgi:hypothetical protein
VRSNFKQVNRIRSGKLKKNPITVFEVKSETLLESALESVRLEEWMVWVLNKQAYFLVKVLLQMGRQLLVRALKTRREIDAHIRSEARRSDA